MTEIAKCKDMFRGTKVCEAEEQKKCFLNPKIEIEIFGKCVN